MKPLGGCVGMGGCCEDGGEPDEMYRSNGRGREHADSVWNHGEIKFQEQSRTSWSY